VAPSAFYYSRAQAFALLPLARRLTEWQVYIGLARSTDFIGRAANARTCVRPVTVPRSPPGRATPTGRSPPGYRAVETVKRSSRGGPPTCRKGRPPPLPGHYSRFDVEAGGQQTWGHATQNLPQYGLRIDGNGDIYAEGVDELLYGRLSNVL
jgi:hypothetical protein